MFHPRFPVASHHNPKGTGSTRSHQHPNVRRFFWDVCFQWRTSTIFFPSELTSGCCLRAPSSQVSLTSSPDGLMSSISECMWSVSSSLSSRWSTPRHVAVETDLSVGHVETESCVQGSWGHGFRRLASLTSLRVKMMSSVQCGLWKESEMVRCKGDRQVHVQLPTRNKIEKFGISGHLGAGEIRSILYLLGCDAALQEGWDGTKKRNVL